MHSVAVALIDGISLFELALPSGVFGLTPPEEVDSWYELTLCGPPGARVRGGLLADTGHGLDELARADTVIVPACPDLDRPPPAELVEAVRAAHQGGARVASICTGAFVLAAAGLLEGRRATTHWVYAAELARRHPGVRVDPQVLYVDDGDVLTSAGKAAGLDLCVHMVRSDHGAAVANGIARRLVIAPHRAGGQAQFITTPVPETDPDALAEVLAWALARLEQPLTVTDLARRASMSPRHLGRRFTEATGTTPLRWLLTQRVSRAQELLERTGDSVDLIADRVGMGTAATLRRHFHRAVGVPPDAYRRAFRAAPPGESGVSAQ